MSEEIVRRLRSRSNRGLLFLKESTHDRDELFNDEDEDEDTPEEESALDGEDTADEDSGRDSREEDTPHAGRSTPHRPRASKSPAVDREAPQENREAPKPKDTPHATAESMNPLDNAYAVRFKIGDSVSVSYANGTSSKLKGVIDGYDKEGFYRVRWSNGSTTNGITDLALLDAVDNVAESKCLCGHTKFVTEGNSVVCDACGRRIRESHTQSTYAYTVYYDYDGDELSDYQSRMLVVASTAEEALEKAKAHYPEGRRFSIEQVYASVEEFQKKFPQHNLDIVESSDPLMLADKSRPKGKKIIRSEAHPMSTAAKPSISESIRKAITESMEEDEEVEEDDSSSIINKLERALGGEFWSRLEELRTDIEDLGYYVADINMEYVIVQVSEDDEDYEMYIPIVGTSRTMTLEFDKSKVYKL